MSKEAGFNQEYADSFVDRIVGDGPLLREFITYLATKKFTCENKVCGYSIVDILVFQMDHFKAFLDRGDEDTVKDNECKMLLCAFDTFMKMKENPEEYVRLMGEESGSDYDGKF